MLAQMSGSLQLEHKERYATLATKLQRTMTAQIDSLAKFRGKDKTTSVGSVTVNNGGQAVVGTVNVEGRRGENGG